MIDIEIEYHSGIPVYKQIISGILSAVQSGAVSVGDKLPSIRKLSEQLNVNPNTTAKVYRELELKGHVQSRPGSGCFVRVQDGEPLSPKERNEKLEELYVKLMGEARSYNISERDFLRFVGKKRSSL